MTTNSAQGPTGDMIECAKHGLRYEAWRGPCPWCAQDDAKQGPTGEPGYQRAISVLEETATWFAEEVPSVRYGTVPRNSQAALYYRDAANTLRAKQDSGPVTGALSDVTKCAPVTGSGLTPTGDDGRLQARIDEQAALLRKINEDNALERTRLVALIGELHSHLELTVRYIEEPAVEGDSGAREQFLGRHQAALSSVLKRSSVYEPSWEFAQSELRRVRDQASHVPGLTATLAEACHDRDTAVRLLHMLDNQEARHPDVAAFLDTYNPPPAWVAPATGSGEQGADCVGR